MNTELKLSTISFFHNDSPTTVKRIFKHFQMDVIDQHALMYISNSIVLAYFH